MVNERRIVSILHVASFTGNTGDVANHLGFRQWFTKIIGRRINWIELEIRDNFRKIWQFDDSFIALANSCDLVVFGGGNYLELWPSQSQSGTSIDLLPDQYREISTPIFFNALGIDAAQGISDNASRRFPEFLDYVLTSENHLLSVRNDGSLNQLRNFLPKSELEKVVHLPDAGFFLNTAETVETIRQDVLSINLACDMPELRFGKTQLSDFATHLAKEIETLLMDFGRFDVCLIPHVYSDMSIIAEFLKALPDSLRRDRVQVAKYAPTASGLADTLDAYAVSKAVLAMRFHSNVIPLGLGIPTVGLSTYPQIKNLYSEVNLDEYVIEGSLESMKSKIVSEKLGIILDNSPQIFKRFLEVTNLVKSQRYTASLQVSNWLGQVQLLPES